MTSKRAKKRVKPQYPRIQQGFCLRVEAAAVRELRGLEVEKVSSRAIFLPPAGREGRLLSGDKTVCAQDKPTQQRTAS